MRMRLQNTSATGLRAYQHGEAILRVQEPRRVIDADYGIQGVDVVEAKPPFSILTIELGLIGEPSLIDVTAIIRAAIAKAEAGADV